MKVLVVFVALFSGVNACSHQTSPELGSKHHDEVLFQRATTAVQQKQYTIANLDLQALVNTYPDSKYANRAKKMLQDPRIARCSGGFSNTTSLCDPEGTAARRRQ